MTHASVNDPDENPSENENEKKNEANLNDCTNYLLCFVGILAVVVCVNVIVLVWSVSTKSCCLCCGLPQDWMSPDRLIAEGLGERLRLTVVSASGLPRCSKSHSEICQNQCVTVQLTCSRPHRTYFYTQLRPVR